MGIIQAHDRYCALYFYYYSSNSTSGHQSLDPRGWDSWFKGFAAGRRK